MDAKVIGIIAILVVAVLAYAVFVGMRKTAVPEGTLVTDEEVSILSNQIDALTEEMIDEIMADMDVFSASAETDMATDLGMFMYQ
jgi:hypothetical protein